MADRLDPNPDFFGSESWTLGVAGLGYVGLPLLVAASEAGLGVVGYDIAPDRAAELSRGESPVDDVSDKSLERALEAGAIFTSDVGALADADMIAICVPSPLGRTHNPDLSYVIAAANSIAEIARPGRVVVLESTTYPGTTEEIVVAAFEAAGFELDTDIWVAYSPERVSPGDPHGTADIPKVVGGVTRQSGRLAAAAYRRFIPDIHVVSSSRVAEMAKLLENTYRAVNIGLINELAQLAHTLGIDIWEVVEAAGTKPFGFQAFSPGPGVGGHCIPLDPKYLAWRAREAGFTTSFIDLAEQVNREMPRYNAGRVATMLNTAGLPVYGTKVLAIGIAYKPNISDARESASLEVLRELGDAGAEVDVLDPIVSPERTVAFGYTPVKIEDDLGEYAIAVVLTDHDGIDYQRIAAEVPLVYDTRGVYRRLGITGDNIETL